MGVESFDAKKLCPGAAQLFVFILSCEKLNLRSSYASSCAIGSLRGRSWYRLSIRFLEVLQTRALSCCRSSPKHSPSSDVDTATSPSYHASPFDKPSEDQRRTSPSNRPSSDVDTAQSPVYGSSPTKETGNEQQPPNDAKSEEDKQPSTANSLSSSSSIGSPDDEKKAKKKHKRGHSKPKKSKGGKGSKRRDKNGSSSSSNHSKSGGAIKQPKKGNH
uniref:Uncharacterized protein n=1 Tax=Ditylenchus dipsaci TaxID=166011 RepID=A0A915E6T1_9BILA